VALPTERRSRKMMKPSRGSNIAISLLSSIKHKRREERREKKEKKKERKM